MADLFYRQEKHVSFMRKLFRKVSINKNVIIELQSLIATRTARVNYTTYIAVISLIYMKKIQGFWMLSLKDSRAWHSTGNNLMR